MKGRLLLAQKEVQRIGEAEAEMAEVAVSTVVQKLTGLVVDQAVEAVSRVADVREEVESLKRELGWMQGFLRDADAKADEGDEGSQRVRVWVSEIRDAAFEAEELIETYVYRASNSMLERMLRPLRLSDVRTRIHRIRSRVEDVSQRLKPYGLVKADLSLSQSQGCPSSRFRHWRHPSPYSQQDHVIELQDAVQALLSQLLAMEPRRHVVSIVGMGGLGKTTLANKLYNHGQIAKHFECKAWVYVSKEYRRRDILQGILKAVADASDTHTDRLPEEELVNKVRNVLDERRYLLFLDDIWGMEVWDVLESAFPKGQKGSKILLTTRNWEVALHADALSEPHQLRVLTQDESFRLLCNKAFFASDSIPTDLQDVAKDIAGKCGGLPLAVVVVGGLLSRKIKSSHEWTGVLKNISWHLQKEEEERLAGILALSYSDLPPHLKSCFLHLGLFPEGINIHTKKLIRLWVAEGFLPQEGEETAEGVAQRCLNELIGRCMIQVGTVSSLGRVKTIRIHDRLRYLSVSKGKEGYFLKIYPGDVPGSSTSQPTKSRRHSIHSCYDRYDFLKHSANHSCSLLFFNREFNEDIARRIRFPNMSFLQEKKLNIIFRKFKLLRVLELDCVRLVSLPNAIGDLIQLRYLGLRKTNLEEELPPSIGNLQNLQTLDLRYCCFLKKIPNVIWKMVNLRHLLLYTPFDSPDSGHLRMDTLTNLQSLPYIEAGNWMEDAGLARMSNLRQLGIYELSGIVVNSVLSAAQGLSNLHSLSLSLQSEEDEFPIFVHLSQCTHLQKLSLNGKIKKLPDPHEFPPNLLKLTLHNSHLQKDSITKLERLASLKMLILGEGAYDSPELSFSAEGFSQLHILRLILLKELVEWTVEERAMPKLEHIVIDRCEKLRRIPEGLKAITSLKKLKIIGMPVEFEHRLRTRDLLEFINTPAIESTTDILAIAQ